MSRLLREITRWRAAVAPGGLAVACFVTAIGLTGCGGVAGARTVAQSASLRRVQGPLTISDLGQPGELSRRPQPPIRLEARGTCAEPLMVETPCPAGSWPAFGEQGGQVLHVAGGDKLRLTFDMPLASVRFSATTDFPNPTNHPDVNLDVIGITSSDPASTAATVWTLTLPQLDRLTHILSIVGSGHGAPQDFSVAIVTPRSSDPGASCPGFFYNSGQPYPDCKMIGVPPAAP